MMLQKLSLHPNLPAGRQGSQFHFVIVSEAELPNSK